MPNISISRTGARSVIRHHRPSTAMTPAFALPPAAGLLCPSPRLPCGPPRRLALARAAPRMALRAVEGYNGAFGLDPRVRDKLVALLTAPDFATKVAKEAHAERAFFTGDLFQPVPYSANTPLGMPRDMERYARDADFVVINIPATTMFEARCSKPARLAAVFKLFEIDPEVRARFQEKVRRREEDMKGRAEKYVAQAPVEGEDVWAGLGELIQKTLRDGDELDEAEERELDDLVV